VRQGSASDVDSCSIGLFGGLSRLFFIIESELDYLTHHSLQRKDLANKADLTAFRRASYRKESWRVDTGVDDIKNMFDELSSESRRGPCG
jgi:hypothetical protein